MFICRLDAISPFRHADYCRLMAFFDIFIVAAMPIRLPAFHTAFFFFPTFCIFLFTLFDCRHACCR